MKKTIFIILFFTFNLAFGEIPERYRPRFEEITFSPESFLKGNFGKVIGRGGFNSIELYGQKVFGQETPISKDLFIQNLEDLGSDYTESQLKLMYQDYVENWLVEKITPHYFRAVLDLEAKNYLLPKSLVSSLESLAISLIIKNYCSTVELDTIVQLRNLILKQTNFILPISETELKILGFQKDDFGTILNPLLIDLTQLYLTAKNEQILDQDFYTQFLSMLEVQIVRFLKSTRRTYIVEQEMANELNNDPLIFMMDRNGDDEFIYDQIISNERSLLKQMNYRAPGLKILFNNVNELDKFKLFLDTVESRNRLELVVKYLVNNSIDFSEEIIEKHPSNESFENMQELWNPLRIMKSQSVLIPSKISPLIYFLGDKVEQLDVYTYDYESKYAKEIITDEINQRKTMLLQYRLAHRLSLRNPMSLQYGKCTNGQSSLCFPENIFDLLINNIVRVNGDDRLNPYLQNFDNSRLLQSL